MAPILPDIQTSYEHLIDAWDFKGRPADRSKTGGWTSAAMILGVELCERLTTLGIAVNLVTYLTGTMHLGSAASANTVTNFLGTSFMLCLLGGFIGDAFLGRYLTIAIFAVVQASGVTVLTISTAAPGLRPPHCSDTKSSNCTPATAEQLAFLYLGLYLTALGTGGLKSSVSGFGSDQFDDKNPTEKCQMVTFFNWFFFFINIGALLAVTVLVYIQDNVGRRWGYGICAAAIILGVAVFLSGTNRYRFKRLAGSPLTHIAAVVVAAWRKRGLVPPSDPDNLYVGEGVDSRGVKGKENLPHTEQFRFLDHAAIIEDEGQKIVLKNKWRLSTRTDVEEVKMVIRMLPIWATTIMFWTVYAQMTTFSVTQATTMNRYISSFQIPSGSLTVFFVGAILLTVPLYDSLLLPIARRITGHPNGLSNLQRITLGLFLSILAMAAASLTERKRLHVSWRNPTAAENAATTVPISVFWLIPQFMLVGAGEAFVYTGQLEFFLRECPKGMKTMSAGLFLSTLALGFFLSSALVAVVHRVAGGSSEGGGAWLADNLNEGRLYNFYALLSVMSTVNLGLFLVAARWYVSKVRRPMEEEDDNGAVVEMAEVEA